MIRAKICTKRDKNQTIIYKKKLGKQRILFFAVTTVNKQKLSH